MNEFLPQIVGQAIVDDVLRHGRRFYRPRRGQAFIPVEFQAAPTGSGTAWSARPTARTSPVTTGSRSSPSSSTRSQDGSADPADLRGGSRAARRFVGWQTFFDFGDGQVKPNKRIDTMLSTPLFHLPLGAIASHDAPTSLPQRNLLRHLTWSCRPARASRARSASPFAAPTSQELASARRGSTGDAALVLRPARGGIGRGRACASARSAAASSAR